MSGNDLPGPGAYSGKLDPVREKGPAFTMGGKYKGKLGGGDAPGPGQYSAKGGFSTIGGVMGAKHGGRNGAHDANPGPGSYNYGNTFNKQGGALSKGGRGGPGRYNDAPGPGSYNYGPTTDR